MIGLLYKDFIAVKGKVYVVALLLQFAFVSLFCLLLNPRPDNAEFALALEGMAGSFFLIAVLFFCMSFVFGLVISLMQSDDGKYQKQYHLCLPGEKNQYVASKFLFLLIGMYLSLSVFLLESMVCRTFMASDRMVWFIDGIQSILPVLFSNCMILCAIDLTVFFAFGSQLGKLVKEGFVIMLSLLLVSYLLFGDLTIWERMDLPIMLKYLISHVELLMGLEILFPAVALGLYGLAYLASCRLFLKRGWQDE